MKKYTKVLALALALTMLLSMSVFAADYEVNGETGTSAVLDGEKFNLTTPAENGKMYLLLVLSGGESIPTASNILYVNQKTAEGSSITFENVYPKSIANSTIYLAGGSAGLTKIGAVEVAAPAFKLGDVNGDGEVNILDYQRLYAHLDNSNALGANIARGDVNQNGEVDILDLQRLYAHLDGSNLLK